MSGRIYGTNIQLPSLDNLFSSEADRQDAGLEKVQQIPLDELYPFRDHPFQVRDDEEMQRMVQSIKEYGILTPAIVRPRAEGGYELVSGHRRHHGGRLAGLDTLPCIVREMDDDAAIIFMVDANCQRENILPSEKAKAYQMKLEALNRQGKRVDLTFSQVGKKLNSYEEIATVAGESRNQVHRYIRLNNLIPELQALVDDKTLKFNPAVELSYLTPEEQADFLDYIESMECTPSLSQAQKLKAASKEAALTPAVISQIMESQQPSVKPRERQLSFAVSEVERYFPKGYSTQQMTNLIIKLLENYQRSRQDVR